MQGAQVGHNPSRKRGCGMGKDFLSSPMGARGTAGFIFWKGRPGRPNPAGFFLPQSPYPSSHPSFLLPPTSSLPSRSPPPILGTKGKQLCPTERSTVQSTGSHLCKLCSHSHPHRVLHQNHTISEIEIRLSSPPCQWVAGCIPVCSWSDHPSVWL